jgi:hypothetical protein
VRPVASIFSAGHEFKRKKRHLRSQLIPHIMPSARARFVIIWCIIYGAGSQEFTLKTNTSCSRARWLAGRTAIYYLFIVIAESLRANTTQRWTNYYNFTNHIIRPTRAHRAVKSFGIKRTRSLFRICNRSLSQPRRCERETTSNMVTSSAGTENEHVNMLFV